MSLHCRKNRRAEAGANQRSVIPMLFAVLAFSGMPLDTWAEDQDDDETAKHPAGLMDSGQVIGTQPGPDRDIPELINPYSEDAEAISEGRRLFVWMNCSGCHGGNAGGGMGPSLRDTVWLYGNKAGDIYNSIVEGRQNGMPAWGMTLPSDQLWKITAYVESLGTSMEPKPPPKNPVYPNPPSQEASNEREIDTEDVTATESDETH